MRGKTIKCELAIPTELVRKYIIIMGYGDKADRIISRIGGKAVIDLDRLGYGSDTDKYQVRIAMAALMIDAVSDKLDDILKSK